jgi:hypothetical protein
MMMQELKIAVDEQISIDSAINETTKVRKASIGIGNFGGLSFLIICWLR